MSALRLFPITTPNSSVHAENHHLKTNAVVSMPTSSIDRSNHHRIVVAVDDAAAAAVAVGSADDSTAVVEM